MSEFRSPLCVEEIDEFGGIWQLTAPLRYYSDLLKRELVADTGMKTDFASVPRILGIYDLEGGRCNKAAVIHDMLYSAGSAYGGVDRATADKVLREAILASGYGAATANLFYAAVRIGGGSHWRQANVVQPMKVDAGWKAFAAGLRA